MATSNFSTYDQVGKKEDIADIITNIAPTKTPFQTMIGSETADNTLFQWQEDTLNAPGVNAAIEGADAPVAVQNATVMRSNVTQILTKTAKATGSTTAMKTYGREGELAYQKSLRAPELKLDLEYAMVGVHQAAVTGSTGVARRMASYNQMVDVSAQYVVNGAGGALGAVAGGETAAAIREDVILAVLQQLYIAGAEADVVMVTPATKPVVSALAHSSRTIMVDNGDKKLTNTVDVYDSDFGPVKFVINRNLKAGDALVFESGMWKKVVYRNWQSEVLAKTGDSTNVQMLGEFSLKHRNFKGSGLITNLNT